MLCFLSLMLPEARAPLTSPQHLNILVIYLTYLLNLIFYCEVRSIGRLFCAESSCWQS